MSNIIDWHDNLADVPAFYTGTGASQLVPDVFPVAIDGRPYMIDQQSKDFMRGFEPRIRDSFDQGTEPGEATINPQGLWRRNQNSWHAGAGQTYADVDSDPFRFFKSKGVNPWVKGQLTLLNDTQLSLSSAATNIKLVVAGDRVYAATGADVQHATNPYGASPTWTACTSEPGGNLQAMTTDGYKVYMAFPSAGVHQTNTGTNAISAYITSSDDYYMLGFAKNYLFGTNDENLYNLSGGTKSSAIIDHRDTNFRWVGVATGQNAIYAAGYSGNISQIFKITIKTDGTLDTGGIVSLELPHGEVVTAIHGYLGFIILGTNKGVRFCSTDVDSNLVAGTNIPTTGSVRSITAEGQYVWFGYSNYDGVSTGLGRLDLALFNKPNTPAYATDLMYTSTADVLSCITLSGKRVFTVSGVGVVAENDASKVASGSIETGRFRWGIMDRKFVVKVDLRTLPLTGSVSFYTSLDGNDYFLNGTSSIATAVQHTFNGTETKMIEASFKVVLNRDATVTSGPIVTRITGRAYVTPTRSEYFKVPVMLHRELNVWGQMFYYDVNAERAEFRELINNPRVITYQEGNEIYSVIVEDMEWQPSDARGREWEWDGTAIITMRSIQE